jgi:anti-sigma-K factor RskA
MSEQRRITSEDLTLYAMQLLSAEERAEITASLQQSAEARRELAEIQGDLATYALTVDMHTPPVQARERLLRQVGREKKTAPIDRSGETSVRTGSIFADSSAGNKGVANETLRTERGLGSGDYLTEDEPKRGIVGKVLPWAGWAMAAGLALTAGNLYRERETLHGTVATQASQLDHLTADAAAARQLLDTMTDSSAMRVTLTTKGATAPLPTGRATYVASKGSLIFLASNLEPLQPAKTYELWLIPAVEGGSPIPAGTFHPDARGNASVIMPPLPRGVEAKAFGVTVEDEGGATTPTQPIILAGE